MRYCTLSDLQAAVPLQSLIWLSNEDSAATEVNAAVIDQVVTEAEELVDAHLRGRYTLPLAAVPSVLKGVTVNLARHALYARRPEGPELPKAITETFKAAMRTLENIRDGQLSIGLASTGAAMPEPGEVRARARRRQFGSDVLDRY